MRTKEDFMVYFNNTVISIMNSVYGTTGLRITEEKYMAYYYAHEFMHKAYHTIDSLRKYKSAGAFVKNVLKYLDYIVDAKNLVLDENVRNRYIETRHIISEIATEGGFLNENE